MPKSMPNAEQLGAEWGGVSAWKMEKGPLRIAWNGPEYALITQRSKVEILPRNHLLSTSYGYLTNPFFQFANKPRNPKKATTIFVGAPTRMAKKLEGES